MNRRSTSSSLALLGGGTLVVVAIVFAVVRFLEPDPVDPQVAGLGRTDALAARLPSGQPEGGVRRPGEILLSGTNLYSQNEEELVIRDFFQDKREGFFLDVGCAWPVRNSTTYYLEKHLGWSGIAVDALSKYGPAWEKERPNSEFVSYAVSDRSGERVTFYRHDWTGVSSLSKEQSAQYGGEERLTPIEVETITLTDLLDQRGVTKLDHLTLDIEGAELLALAGFDIERFRPEFVCIEAHAQGEEGEAAILQYFEEHGYELVEEYLPHSLANWYFAPKAEPNPES